MLSAIYINAGAELNLAQQVAANVIENRLYAERGLPASLEQADEWLREAQSEAAQLFQQPGQLANLLSGLAMHDPWLARAIEVTVHERLTGFREAAVKKTQTPDAATE